MANEQSRLCSVELDEDEIHALEYAAHRVAGELRRQGWKDMADNAAILDRALEKLEAAEHAA